MIVTAPRITAPQLVVFTSVALLAFLASAAAALDLSLTIALVSITAAAIGCAPTRDASPQKACGPRSDARCS